MNVIQRIRKAVRDGQYDFTDHARDEAEQDGLWIADILSVLLTGVVDSVFTDDPRGTRYVVRGEIDKILIDVVCRFEDDGKLLIIITVYVVD